MSGYVEAKKIIKSMRLTGEEQRKLATQAYDAELARNQPLLAMKCVKDFGLSDALLNRAAVYLFVYHLNQRQYDQALAVARTYDLAHGDLPAQRAMDAASKLAGGDDALEEIRELTREAGHHRQQACQADQAIELIQEAAEVRDRDPHVAGRAVELPENGEVWLTGDLHGNVQNLRRFAALAELERHPDRILVLQEIVHSRLITSDNRDLSFVAILEALRLMVRFPGRVYYLLGNHDLALHLERDVIKGGKDLNRYLFRGMAWMYRERHEDVLNAYREFIARMPAALLAPNGVFMSHSTPKRPFVPTLSRKFLTEVAPTKPFKKLQPIVALVNGRDFSKEAAEEFADRLECDVMLCGHTPTNDGYRVPSPRHLIIDSQHGMAHYARFDLSERYRAAVDLAEELHPLWPEGEAPSNGSSPLL